jgi:hypothetical protein
MKPTSLSLMFWNISHLEICVKIRLCAILPRKIRLFYVTDDVHLDVFCGVLDRAATAHKRVRPRVVRGSNRAPRRK